jgi:hypothetical protein
MLSFSYRQLHSRSQKRVVFLLVSFGLCLSVIALIIVLLGLDRAHKIHGSLVSSTWVCLLILTPEYARLILILVDYSCHLEYLYDSNTGLEIRHVASRVADPGTNRVCGTQYAIVIVGYAGNYA